MFRGRQSKFSRNYLKNGLTMMKYRLVFIFGVVLAIQIFLLLPSYGLKNLINANAQQLQLTQALMCEDVFNNAPRNPTVIFSASREKAICYTSFDPVPVKTNIFHNWFHRDVPSAKIQLILNSPRWSTYSSIQLRKTDIGPWRVEITDENGNILDVLRFSVTD
jgi:Protein of unknown function (DUF2914)